MKRFAVSQSKPAVTTQEDVDKFWQRRFNLTAFLFDKQLAFVEDPSPFKVAVCSRRAGKTIACAAHLIHEAINNPGVMCIYITLSYKNAERIIWKDLKKINEDYNLRGIAKTDLSMTFRNGSTIYCCGANNITEIENFRGVPLKLVYIDECQSFKAYIEGLIDDVLSPALMDHAGTLCLIGTPGPVPTGYFHKCAVESEVWSKHGWTFFDNPHLPAVKAGKITHQGLLDRELKRRGVTVDTPSVQREWFGKWILDSDSLILHYTSEKNHFDTLPTLPNNAKYVYVLGIDIGFDDADAIAVLAYSDFSPTTYLVEELVIPKQGITELVEEIQSFQKKYEISKMVMDMGGLGKKIGEEMSRRYQIPVEPAEKSRKMENLELLDDALRTGRFKASNKSRFAQDSYLVEKDKDKSTPDRIAISNRFHSDIVDSVLYSFKLSPAYSYVEPSKAPAFGSKEWAEQQSHDMFQAELEGLQAEQSDFNKIFR